jgi:hypothetical protein
MRRSTALSLPLELVFLGYHLEFSTVLTNTFLPQKKLFSSKLERFFHCQTFLYRILKRTPYQSGKMIPFLQTDSSLALVALLALLLCLVWVMFSA